MEYPLLFLLTLGDGPPPNEAAAALIGPLFQPALYPRLLLLLTLNDSSYCAEDVLNVLERGGRCCTFGIRDPPCAARPRALFCCCSDPFNISVRVLLDPDAGPPITVPICTEFCLLLCDCCLLDRPKECGGSDDNGVLLGCCCLDFFLSVLIISANGVL